MLSRLGLKAELALQVKDAPGVRVAISDRLRKDFNEVIGNHLREFCRQPLNYDQTLRRNPAAFWGSSAPRPTH